MVKRIWLYLFRAMDVRSHMLYSITGLLLPVLESPVGNVQVLLLWIMAKKTKTFQEKFVNHEAIHYEDDL